jgi:hypothetical protein
MGRFLYARFGLLPASIRSRLSPVRPNTGQSLTRPPLVHWTGSRYISNCGTGSGDTAVIPERPKRIAVGRPRKPQKVDDSRRGMRTFKDSRRTR